MLVDHLVVIPFIFPWQFFPHLSHCTVCQGLWTFSGSNKKVEMGCTSYFSIAVL